MGSLKKNLSGPALALLCLLALSLLSSSVLAAKNLDPSFGRSSGQTEPSSKSIALELSGQPFLNLSLILNTYFCNDVCTAIIEVDRANPSLFAGPETAKLRSFESASYWYVDFRQVSPGALGVSSVKYYISTPKQKVRLLPNGTVAEDLWDDYKEIIYPFELFNLQGRYRLKIEGVKSGGIEGKRGLVRNDLDWVPAFYGLEITEWANWSSAPTGGVGNRNITLYSPINNFNATADSTFVFMCNSTNPAAEVRNVSLWTNATGTWKLNQTLLYAAVSNRTSYTHNGSVIYAYGTVNETLGNKIAISNSSNFWLYSINKSSVDGAVYGFLLNGSNRNVLARCVFVGNDCRFNITQKLEMNLTYYISFNSSSPVARYREDFAVSLRTFPIATTYYTVTATDKGGVDDTQDIYTWSSLNGSNVAPRTSVSSAFNYTITPSLNKSFVWSCQAFDEDLDYGWALANFSAVMTYRPNLTIIQPSGTVSSTTFDVQINASDELALSYCFFNITRGAAVEITNTPIPNCNSTVETTVSGDGTYTVWAFANDTHNNINTTNLTFTVSTSGQQGGGGGSSGGGGGGGLTTIYTALTSSINKTDSVCEPFRPAFRAALEEARQEDFSFASIRKILLAIYDLALCRSAASIVPV